ncbi:MAG TPA: hypothetical protein VLW05_10155 [Gaiellaceae bacterium]|nr:hypothetical protein [Gaiellaceae bacterium]
MPTRKQKRRQAKEQRHDYEFVYVDSEGQEVDVADDASAAPAKTNDRRNGSASAAQQKGKAPQKGGRAGRVPQPPSWQRAARRAALLGIVVFILFSFTASRSHAGWAAALLPAVIYTALFIPFTYMIDRYAYNRYLTKQKQGGGAAAKKQPPKKR